MVSFRPYRGGNEKGEEMTEKTGWGSLNGPEFGGQLALLPAKGSHAGPQRLQGRQRRQTCGFRAQYALT